MKTELMRAHRLLCSAFIDEELFRRGLGGGRGDLRTVAAYLQLPPADRPALSWFFDPDFYRATNPGLDPAADPLLHFLETGIAELRSPHPLIDLRAIAEDDAYLLGMPPRIEALMEMLGYDLARPSPYFDPDYYAGQLGAAAPENGLLRHFLSVGLAEGRRPNAWFDGAWYAARNADVPADPYSALRHFVMLGDRQARAPGPEFDSALYRARYTDVADAGVPPLRHYLRFGQAEGRQASADRAPAIASTAAAPSLGTGPDAVVGAWAGIAERAAQRRQRRKDALRPVAPVLQQSLDPVADAAALAFPACAAPRVSVLVPMFDELDFTLECLLSLAAHPPCVPFEVVVADDCSTDPDVACLAGVANLVYLRAAQNQGFLRNCNAAFARCRGDYVLLLNNDAQVLEGAIDRLVGALDADPDVAAVGPKIIYPSGRLQEAGCSIRPNGESVMTGLFRDAGEGGFCYDRDVTYCSGAALMLRRGLVEGELFDEAFRPAYCEDADLCLQFIAQGWRIRYVHAAVVVHHLSVSSNRKSVARKLRGIARNQHKLVERWGTLLRKLDEVRVLAFYLPQFHPTPENDLWWGRGFTEWTNVAPARPSYDGHYQPHLPADLGFYDLRLPEALAAQAELAERYGIEGFVVYHYNFGERRMLSRPIEVVRAHPEIAFRWCLCWANENWTKHWDGGTREILLEQLYDDATLEAVIADAVAQAADPRYIRVGGKPLFLVYRPLLIPDPPGFAAACRAAFARAGFSGVHLAYVESMEAVNAGVTPAELGFDACVEFPFHGMAAPRQDSVDVRKPGWAGYRYDYPDSVLNFVHRDSVPYPRYPAVCPSWDNTARQPMRGTSFDAATPEAFRFYVEEKIEEVRAFLTGDERLLFVNAWNEWAEGAHLEPDQAFGHRWLEALRDGVAAKRWA